MAFPYTPPMRILGIDPGLRITGYACVEGPPEDPHLVEGGVFRLSVASGSAAASVSERLLELHTDFSELLERLKPEAAAVESLFVHYNHPATAIVMGHARGVLLLAIRAAGVSLLEYKPNEVKKFMTGHGHASKQQIQDAVQARLHLAQTPDPPDLADAIAIALCAAWRCGLDLDTTPPSQTRV